MEYFIVLLEHESMYPTVIPVFVFKNRTSKISINQQILIALVVQWSDGPISTLQTNGPPVLEKKLERINHPTFIIMGHFG